MDYRTTSLALIVLLTLSGCDQLGGASSYEDCVLSEMKGRNMDQQYLVEDSCRQKFPKLKSFTSTSKTGALACTWDKGNKTPFEIMIEDKKLSSYLGEFDVILRERSLVRSKSHSYTMDDRWKDGALLVINFVEGGGVLYDANNSDEQFGFSCSDAPLIK